MDLCDLLDITITQRKALPPLLVVDLAGRVHLVKRPKKAQRAVGVQLSMLERRKPGPKSERPALERAIGQAIPDEMWACLLKRRQHGRGGHPITLEAVLAEMRLRGILRDC
jgi:hypothetical protein